MKIIGPFFLNYILFMFFIDQIFEVSDDVICTNVVPSAKDEEKTNWSSTLKGGKSVQ